MTRTPAALLALAERLDGSLETLANTPMPLSLIQWQAVTNPLIEAAAALRAKAQEKNDGR